MTAQTRLERDGGTTLARPTRTRWAIVILLFVFYTINSVDRSALSVALPFIGDDFHVQAPSRASS